jgi:hypothetical protein
MDAALRRPVSAKQKRHVGAARRPYQELQGRLGR